MNKNIVLIAVATIMILQSCVPQRKYAEMQTGKVAAEQENEELRKAKEQLEAQNKELLTTKETQAKSIVELSTDTADLGKEYRQLRMQYDKINELNDILSKKSNELLSQATGENKKLVDELNKTQEALQKKEDMLKGLEKNLNEKQAAIDLANKELEEKQKRVDDMEKLLAEQQAASEALKTKVQNALLGFKDKGLTVTEKDGKVYVSMEAKLLFATGSTAVDPNGKKALIDLAKAIENEADMEIIVEGHTDTDKLASSSYPKDNWDLSVLRATEVVKILLANSTVKPQVLSASGRSEFHPVDTNDKSKNRRIEIILQPKLDELYKLIEGN
ncbi:MAG: OmpA family protein [Flavobacteriales bacterium]|nr:OmpA family protein [Flavobacteriales bacterium]